MKTKIVGLIAGIVIIAMLVSVMPASAGYDIHPSTKNSYAATCVVQLDYDGYGDAYSLYMSPGSAADVVLHVAELYGMDIFRTHEGVCGEIRAHAMAYMCGERARSNPIDVEMFPAPTWYYLLD